MTENIYSIRNASAIHNLIEENKKIEKEIGELEHLYWQNIAIMAMLGDASSRDLLLITGGVDPFDIDFG
ncbi:MAG: hypothetical protein SOI56_06105 [Eubacteriales bacterium]